jgi:hypothetical protein
MASSDRPALGLALQERGLTPLLQRLGGRRQRSWKLFSPGKKGTLYQCKTSAISKPSKIFSLAARYS